MKRSKNIFNSMIAPENILESQGNRQSKIGDLPINSNWLKGVKGQYYIPYIISALKLSQLQKELDDLKEDQVSSPTKQSNLFKVGKTKQKIDQLALQATDDNKPLQQSLANNQPPQTEDLILQKMSQGFFQSLLQRKCRISEKQLYIQSLKDQNNKWIKIGIFGYNLEFEEQDKLLNKPEFAQFKWINGYKQRILVWAPDKKKYCLYGKSDQLKKFQRYFQVQNIEVKQLNVFKSLEAQIKQKIIVYFGKKVRFYDYSIRVRRNQKDAQLDTYGDQRSPQMKQREQEIRQEKQRQKSVGHSSQLGQSSQFSQSSKLESQFLNAIAKTGQKAGTGSIALDVNMSQNKQKKQKKSEKQKQKTADGEIFKLKLKSSIIFYNQIKEPVQFNDQQYKVQDLKLNLRDQIGISDVDEESESRSVLSVKKQSSKKKVTRLTVRNVLNNQQKFNINIFEASSHQKASSSQQKQNQFDLDIPSLGRSSSENLSQFIQASSHRGTPTAVNESGKLNLSQFRNTPSMYKAKQRQFQSIDYLQFEKRRPEESSNSLQIDCIQRTLTPIHQLERQINILKPQKKIDEIDIYESSNKQEVYCTVAFVQMFVPYNSEQLEFQILQIDPQLEIQRKIVTCGRVKQTLKERRIDNQKYTLYQNQGGCHFRFSKASNKFIFVLIQQTKLHYIPFEIDVNLKYKKNQSQLIISQLDRQGYPFAACLGLYASPNPIHLGPRLKTVEFMQKYLNQGEKYDFKHDFIDEKKRLQTIRKEWNKKIAKNALRQGDPQAFGKAVFLGLSDSIFKNLKKKVNYNPKKLFSFTDNQYRLIEENVVTGLIDLKSFLKPLYLIKLVAEGLYNEFMKQRLQHVYVYFLNRYGSIRNLALVFVKQILQKLEPILICCRKEEQVTAIAKLYFQVQYQIDELFLKISSYFKK